MRKMKILIFSDSHGDLDPMKKALSVHKDAEYVFFLGDGLREFAYRREFYPEKTFCAVRGNCDFYGEGEPLSNILNIEGYRFLLCHGHSFSVKSDLSRLSYAAMEASVDAALFGHTHIPYEAYISDADHPFYLFNPGSVSRSSDGRSRYGLVQISRSGILFSHGTV